MRTVLWVLAGVACADATPTGVPDLLVGTGQYAFERVEEGGDVPIIFGPQGGYHIWVGVLAENVERRCVAEVRMALLDEAPTPVGNPLYFDVELFEADDGWLQFAGLPLVVDREQVEDRPVRIDVDLTDDEGFAIAASLSAVPRLL